MQTCGVAQLVRFFVQSPCFLIPRSLLECCLQHVLQGEDLTLQKGNLCLPQLQVPTQNLCTLLHTFLLRPDVSPLALPRLSFALPRLLSRCSLPLSLGRRGDFISSFSLQLVLSILLQSLHLCDHVSLPSPLSPLPFSVLCGAHQDHSHSLLFQQISLLSEPRF